MWITLLAMAVSVSLEPFRIGMTVLMINRPRPPLQLLAFLAGGFAVGTTVGVIVLFILRPALGSAHFTLPRVQIVVGAVLLINAAVIATFVHSFSKLSYDPIKDLVPIGGVGVTPTLLITAGANPPNDLKGLVRWSKDKPEGLNFSTAGYGLLQHLAVEEMGQRLDAKFVHVMYKGGAQASTDLITARVDFGSFAAGSVLPLVKDGKLKPVALIAQKRSGLVPEVPTVAEQGLPGLDAGVHFMLFAPAATPKDVVAVLEAELRKVVGDPALRERFIDIGFEPTPISSAEAAAIVKKTGEDWAGVIKRLNIKLD